MNYGELTILGNVDLKLTSFNTFPTKPNLHEDKFESDELASVCLITGQSDKYTIIINYIPVASYLESKSLKSYLQKFRMFGKSLAYQINDLFDALLPQQILSNLYYKSRGVVSITSIGSHEKERDQ